MRDALYFLGMLVVGFFSYWKGFTDAQSVMYKEEEVCYMNPEAATQRQSATDWQIRR